MHSLCDRRCFFFYGCEKKRLQAPAKRSQHANATYRRNIVGGNMLRAFGHPVATCWDVLIVVGSILTIFKPEPTTPNMSQHIPTRWPNARNMLRPTMLRYVALTCCDRLAGALYPFLVKHLSYQFHRDFRRKKKKN